MEPAQINVDLRVDVGKLGHQGQHLDAYWRRWQLRPGFQAAYADRYSGVPEPDRRGKGDAQGT